MQKNQVQCDKWTRLGSSIDRLKVTRPAQPKYPETPRLNECKSWLKRTSRGRQFQLSTILLKYEFLKLVVLTKFFLSFKRSKLRKKKIQDNKKLENYENLH